MSKQSEIAEFRQSLATNAAWAYRALVVLFRRQTEDEQRAGETVHPNGKGFTGLDAKILSSFAQQVLRGRTLSPKQMVIAQRRLPKYAAQLWLVAQEAKAQTAPAPAPAPAPERDLEQERCDMLAAMVEAEMEADYQQQRAACGME